MRRRAKVDANHREIVRTLRACGWRVLDIHGLPNGADLIAMHEGGRVMRLIEIKSGPKAPLTESQQQMIDEGWPLCIVRSVDDAINLR